MEKGMKYLKMGLAIMEIMFMIWEKGQVYMFGQTDNAMKVKFNNAKCMDKERLNVNIYYFKGVDGRNYKGGFF